MAKNKLLLKVRIGSFTNLWIYKKKSSQLKNRIKFDFTIFNLSLLDSFLFKKKFEWASCFEH